MANSHLAGSESDWKFPAGPMISPRPGPTLPTACAAPDTLVMKSSPVAARASASAAKVKKYTKQKAEQFLRTWAKEDVYFSLDREIELLREAGFSIEIPWRQDSFAVVVGLK